MNIKKVSLILIAFGTLIFVLGFIKEIIKFIFLSNILILGFIALLIGLILLGYSIFKESQESDS